MKDDIILVNEQDEEIGFMNKLEAHEKGLLHRAFSIFIFNTKGELLIQQRALSKYHSAGLWSNTCCSHPMAGETTEIAVKRRLKEEMGMDVEMTRIYHFIYKAHFDNGLTEYEYDHVFMGISDLEPSLNPNEAINWKYIPIKSLREDIHLHPEKYSVWLAICLPAVAEILEKQTFHSLHKITQ